MSHSIDFTPAGQPLSLVDFHAPDFDRFPRFAEALRHAQVAELAPGDALYVPFSMPHWVRAGDEPCISLSVTWQSSWSHRTCNAMRLNHALRKRGLATFETPAWPHSAPVRSTVYRVAHKVGLL